MRLEYSMAPLLSKIKAAKTLALSFEILHERVLIC